MGEQVDWTAEKSGGPHFRLELLLVSMDHHTNYETVQPRFAFVTWVLSLSVVLEDIRC
jgi:hypothetical protein